MSAEVIVDPILLDFSKTCRLCLQQTTELMPLFSENEYSGSPDTSLPSKIMACVSIEVSNESGNIPRQVCCKCIQQIDNWVKFKELCDSANALLHQCLANLQSSDETEKAIIEGDCCINEQATERKVKEEGQHIIEVNNSKSYILVVKGEELNERNNKVDDRRIKCNIESENTAKNDLTEEIGTEFSEENKIKYFNTVETKTSCSTVNDIKRQKISKWKFKYDRYQKKKYRCGLKMCDKFFSRFCDLISHDRSEHEDVRMDKACDICGKMFVSDERIVIHLSIYHGEKKFTCDICDGKFLSKVSLRSHMKKHSGQWVCTDCGSSVGSNMALLEHRRKHSGEKPFACDTCGRSFVTKTSLNSHKQSHTKELLFKCSLCGYTALNHSSMRVHKATHSLKKDCICETCGKMFKLQTRLQEHRKIHDPVKRYVCDVCKMSFTGKYRLTLHSRVHTGERPYVCDICNKQFARQDALKEHIRTHTGEKKYTCQHCSKQFSFLKSFKNHKCSVTTNVNGIRPPPLVNRIVSNITAGKQITMETTSTSTSSVAAEVSDCLYQTG